MTHLKYGAGGELYGYPGKINNQVPEPIKPETSLEANMTNNIFVLLWAC